MSETSGAADAWRRPVPTTRQRRVDLLVAAALAAAAVASVLLARAADFDMGRTPPSSVEEIGWCLVVTLPRAFRRRAPWAADRTMARAVRLVVVVVMFAWLAYVLSATAAA